MRVKRATENLIKIPDDDRRTKSTSYARVVTVECVSCLMPSLVAPTEKNYQEISRNVTGNLNNPDG